LNKAFGGKSATPDQGFVPENAKKYPQQCAGIFFFHQPFS
jgi:hypothetical protein